MIQRIQSVLLALAVGLLGFALYTNAWEGSNAEQDMAVQMGLFKQTVINNASSETPIYTSNFHAAPPATLIIFAISLLIFSIFSFKKRDLQLKLTTVSFILIAGTMGMIMFFIVPQGVALVGQGNNSVFGMAYWLNIASFVLILAARFFIRKDIKLMESVDRIR